MLSGFYLMVIAAFCVIKSVNRGKKLMNTSPSIVYRNALRIYEMVIIVKVIVYKRNRIQRPFFYDIVK